MKYVRLWPVVLAALALAIIGFSPEVRSRVTNAILYNQNRAAKVTPTAQAAGALPTVQMGRIVPNTQANAGSALPKATVQQGSVLPTTPAQPAGPVSATSTGVAGVASAAGSSSAAGSGPSGSDTCKSSSPGSGAYTVKVCFTAPAVISPLSGVTVVTGTVSVTGGKTGVQRMVFYLNGTYLLTDFQSPYTFSLPTTGWMDGSYSIAVEALMRDGFTTGRAQETVSFHNGITTQPTNANTFQPTSGRPAGGAPFVVMAAGDGAGGEANATRVTNLIAQANPNLFLYLGDVYEKGSLTEFYNWYGTSGSYFDHFRSITDPTVGNHEYTSTANASGYFDYWNNVPSYYSFNAGGWHFISLNANSNKEPTGTDSAQYTWLKKDLAANTGACTIVYYHEPYFNIGTEAPQTSMASMWSLMAQNHVTMVLNGHDHDYQRWYALDGSGNRSPNGITEFVAGGGGHGVQAINKTDSRVAYSNDKNPDALGALKLTLSSDGAAFSYMSVTGTVLDSGTVSCQK